MISMITLNFFCLTGRRCQRERNQCHPNPCKNHGRCHIEGDQVSISPTFYEQVFCRKVFWAAFLDLRLRFVFFWQKEIGSKTSVKCWWNWLQGFTCQCKTGFVGRLCEQNMNEQKDSNARRYRKRFVMFANCIWIHLSYLIVRD